MLDRGAVLVPTDFEELSDHAAVEAARWAELLGLELCLVHVVPRALPLGDYLARSHRDALDVAQRALARRAAVFASVPTRVALREGDPVRGILDTIEDETPALVVIGTAAKGAFARLVLGSVATRVLRESATPVMTLNPRSDRACAEGRVRRSGPVLVPMDFGIVSTQALRVAGALARASGRELCLVHVNALIAPNVEMGPVYAAEFQGNAELAERFLEEEAAGTGGARTILLAGEVRSVLLNLIDELEPALVVMGTHGRGTMARFALGSVAERIVREASVPVVTVSALATASRRPHAA